MTVARREAMREQNVGTQHRWGRWIGWTLAFGLCAVGVRASMGKEQSGSARVLIAMPISPPTSGVVPSPPPPVAPIEATVVGTTCIDDLDHVGAPLTPADGASALLVGVAIESDGCILAAWTKRMIHVSWDGGQTFLHVDTLGEIAGVVITAGKVVTLRTDGALGVIRPGHALVWRGVGDAAVRRDRKGSTLFASGAWTVVSFAGAPLAAQSQDDGATWWYLERPDGALIDSLDANGTLLATANIRMSETDEEIVWDARHYAYDSARRSWRLTGPRDQTAATAEWQYILEQDRSWGCGGTSKLVATRPGHRRRLIGELSWPIEIYSHRAVTFANLNNHFYGFRGPRMLDLGEMPEDATLVGVDRAGHAIARTSARLVRWSERGGWRVLLEASEPGG